MGEKFSMKAPHHFSFFFIFSLTPLLTAKVVNTTQFPTLNESHTRRVLHQPLFPISSAPPPSVTPPPPPDNPSSPDIPFFNEHPTGPPPPPPEQNENLPSQSASNGTIANPTATKPTKPTKKVAIALSVAFAMLGTFSVVAFFLYKHRAKHTVAETRKLGGENENSRRVLEDSVRAPPPTSFLYIGTVEPNGMSVGEPNRSPYHSNKLSPIEHRYRPSPELQPLPPLAKPLDDTHSPPAATSSSSSSDNDESRETEFHSPQESSISHEDIYYTPVSRHSYTANGSPTVPSTVSPVVPFSKRTSPKSRFSGSSPDMRHVMIPSIKHYAPPQPPQLSSQFQHVEKEVTLGEPFRRPKFSSPPPAPNLTHLHSNPPPPPPPPLPPRKGWSPAASLSSSSASRIQQQSRSPVSTNSGSVGMSKGLEEGDEMDGGKPKLKALHWDKVRATSDRATVWDQLKSSSFQ